MVENTSLSQLLEWCDVLATRYLTRERNRTKPAPAITDLNNSFTTILKEAGNIFAQDLDVFENKCLSEHIAIILYAVSSLVCPFEGDDANDSYAALIKVKCSS